MVDAHCHLYDVESLEGTEDLNLIICNGAGITTNDKAWEMAQKYKNVYATAGCHPEEMPSSEFNIQSSMFNKLREQAMRSKVVAIGEAGLDYFENTTEEEKEKQRKLFEINIKLAKEMGLPLVVHCRNAFKDVFAMLDYDRVQMHCFTGNEEQMSVCVKRGWYISVGGIVTFKNDNGLRETIKKVPDDQLLTETDAPWLSPEPFRGQKNTPASIKYILECLAKIKNLDIKKLNSKIEVNTRRLFDL